MRRPIRGKPNIGIRARYLGAAGGLDVTGCDLARGPLKRSEQLFDRRSHSSAALPAILWHTTISEDNGALSVLRSPCETTKRAHRYFALQHLSKSLCVSGITEILGTRSPMYLAKSPSWFEQAGVTSGEGRQSPRKVAKSGKPYEPEVVQRNARGLVLARCRTLIAGIN